MRKRIKVEITDEQRARARQYGNEARKTRLSCPYVEGSELAAIWTAARYPRRSEPIAPVVAGETLGDRVGRALSGSGCLVD